MHNYLSDSSDQNYQKIVDELPRFFDGLISNAEVVQAMVGIASLMELSSRKDQVEKFNLTLAKKLLENPDPQLQQLGSAMMDKSIIGAVNFGELRQLILIPDRESIERLEAIVNDICDNPNVSPTVFRNTLDTIEMLGRVNEDALEKRLVAYLRGTSPRITNDEARKEMAQILSEFDVRQNLLGNSFEPLREFPDNEGDGQVPPLTVVLFYSDNTNTSREVINSLEALDLHNEIRFVVVCVDRAIGQDDAAAMQRIFPTVILVEPTKNGDFLRDCPVSTVPYMLLIDRDLKVVAVNVGVDQLRSKIEALQGN